MSLTTVDLSQIRTIVREEVDSIINSRIDPRFDRVDGTIEAVNNDIKDIHEMVSELQKLVRPIAHFEKYDLEQKILTTYKNIVTIAKEAGVTLPRT